MFDLFGYHTFFDSKHGTWHTEIEADGRVMPIEEFSELDGVSFGSYFDIYGCAALKKLPSNMKVGKDCWIKVCPGLTEIPHGLQVGRNLHFDRCVGIKTVSSRITVGQSVYFCDCTGLTEFTEAPVIGDSLYFNGCLNLRNLPTHLTVPGNLGLKYCKELTEFPKEMIVKGHIFLDECVGLSKYCVDVNRHGKLFYGVPMRDGPHVVIDCLNFTEDEVFDYLNKNRRYYRSDCFKLAKEAIKLANSFLAKEVK